MKTRILICVIFILFNARASAQVTVPFNYGIGTDFVGWDGSMVGYPLMIRHDGTSYDPIDFYVNGLKQMQLLPIATTGADAARLGISPEWTTFVPAEQLHQNLERPEQLWHLFTNSRSGYTANDGFKLGINKSIIPEAELRQQENAPMKMIVSDGATNRERIKIWEGLGGNAIGAHGNKDHITKVSILHDGNSTLNGVANYVYPQPVAMLNLGTSFGIPETQQSGNRTWMDVGTYYSFDTDNMYVGLKDMGSNHKDAIINWGDDATDAPDRQNYLKFVFTGFNLNTSSTDPYDYNSKHGLEIARMTHQGNMGIGVGDIGTGVGFSSSLVPKRRLDIFDDGINHNNNNYVGGPQLRLTQQLGSTLLNTGRWTDFQTTDKGDLYIHPRDNGTDKRVGINISTPGNTLEIESPAATATPGASGLRFHDLTTSSTIVTPNPWPSNNRSVLTVDANGDVILVRDEGSTGTGTGDVRACAATSASDNNYVTKWSDAANKEICKTVINDDGANVGVGWPVSGSLTPLKKLDVNGDINLRANASSIRSSIYFHNQRFLATDGLNQNTAVYVGVNAGPGTSNTAAGNIAIGCSTAVNLNTNSEYNTVVGERAGLNIGSGSTDGDANTLMGSQAGTGLTGGDNNVFIGNFAGVPFTTHNSNTAVGTLAGGNSSNVGNNNLFLGANANLVYNNCDYSAAIGADANVEESNTIVLGRCTNGSNVPATRTLIGYTGIGGLPSGNQDALLYVNNASSNSHSAYFNGSIFHNGAWTTSDSTLKTNISSFSATGILNQLSPKTYDFDALNNPQMALPSGTHYGILAQELQQVLPNLVSEFTAPQVRDANGTITHPSKLFKAVNYEELIPILIQGFNEQKDRIDQLEQQLINCCNSNPIQRSANPAIDVELSNSIILNQNDPNPFAEETKITFSIPESVREAKIIFTDNTNHIIQTVKINERGEGQLNVYSSNLSSGIYTYTLIADGKTVDSKRMVCTK